MEIPAPLASRRPGLLDVLRPRRPGDPDVTAHRGFWSAVGSVAASFWFRVGLSLAVLAVLLARIDTREAARSLAAVDLRYFLAAVAVDVAARTVMVVRWAVLLRAGGQSVPNRATARIFLVSSFVGAALPAGGADVTRACALSRSGVGGRAATASVIIDRMLGVVALLTLGVTGLALGALEENLPSARLVAGLCLTAAAAVLAGMIRADRIARFVLPRLLQQAAVGRWLLAAAGEVAGYRSRPRALIGVFGLSVVVQWLRVTEVFLLGAGLGIDAGFGYYLVFMPIGLIVLMLPVSIAGLGLPQGVIIWLLRPAGVSDPQSFALSTLVVVLGVLGTLPGFFLYVRTRGGRA